jgi:hypothetical protein
VKTSDKIKELFNNQFSLDGKIIHAAIEVIREVETLELLSQSIESELRKENESLYDTLDAIQECLNNSLLKRKDG